MDLSLTSLSYAARKAEEYKLRNVEFAQADIMKIADLKRQFDLVISDGVLHHLSDPAEGWRQLVSVLRPGGFMRISLYSDIARRDVVAAQNFVRERGFPPSPDGIRRSRQAILASENPELKSVTMIPDFFTLSETRDLLFHEQEHRLSLPWIREFVDANGLELLGFIVDSSTRKKYRARFPEDEGMDNLETWHRFEQEHPATFLGMYQFWLQRPRVARALMTSSSLR